MWCKMLCSPWGSKPPNQSEWRSEWSPLGGQRGQIRTQKRNKVEKKEMRGQTRQIRGPPKNDFQQGNILHRTLGSGCFWHVLGAQCNRISKAQKIAKDRVESRVWGRPSLDRVQLVWPNWTWDKFTHTYVCTVAFHPTCVAKDDLSIGAFTCCNFFNNWCTIVLFPRGKKSAI